MLEYLTPAKVRAMGLGTALPTTDVELRSLIRIASALVNRECTAPRAHDFRGGTVLNEQHQWNIGNSHIEGQRRIFLNERPIKSIERLDIRVTQGGAGVIAFPSSQIYINTAEDYVELVSLSLTTASVYAAGLIPNIGLARPVAEVDYTYGFDNIVIDEELATTSGNTLYTADGQFWTDDDAVIKVDGVVVATGFEIDRREGAVEFDTDQDDAVVTASYVYPIPPDVQLATAMALSDVAAWTRLNRAGLQGLSGLKVLEVELRQSRSAGLAQVPISPAVSVMLQAYKYRSFA